MGWNRWLQTHFTNADKKANSQGEYPLTPILSTWQAIFTWFYCLADQEEHVIWLQNDKWIKESKNSFTEISGKSYSHGDVENNDGQHLRKVSIYIL